GIVASVDGQQVVKDLVTGKASHAEELGIELAEKMRGQGAQTILEAIFAEIQRD
ncbi:MAG: hydroxymethylbilane synthase, partial [Coleofasciculaceae cyanobacterium]